MPIQIKVTRCKEFIYCKKSLFSRIVKLPKIPYQYISSNGEGMEDLVGAGAFEPGAITNSDINNDDNGSQMGDMVMSDLVLLGLFEEPITDGDFDTRTNMSVDFGLSLKKLNTKPTGASHSLPIGQALVPQKFQVLRHLSPMVLVIYWQLKWKKRLL